MIITAKTALSKIKAGTATITGRVQGEHGMEFIALDDHALSTVHHVALDTQCMSDDERKLNQMA